MPAPHRLTHAKPIGAFGDAARERHGVALMVAGGLLLGTIGVFVEEAAQHPLTTVWFRCVFGGVALLLWGAASGRLHELRLRGRALAAALAAGVLMIANWALFFAAIERTSIAVATVVFHVQPLWVIALGAWWLRERVTRWQLGAALLALAGLTLATGLVDGAAHGPASGDVLSSGYTIGLLMCLGGSLSYAAVTLIAKGAKDRYELVRARMVAVRGGHGGAGLVARAARLAGLGFELGLAGGARA